jgi:hypothetical protein
VQLVHIFREKYVFPGFRAAAELKGGLGEPDVHSVQLQHKKTGTCSCCGYTHYLIYERRMALVRDLGAGGFLIESDFVHLCAQDIRSVGCAWSLWSVWCVIRIIRFVMRCMYAHRPQPNHEEQSFAPLCR